MKHVKQNKNECILASIAVLTGTPYKAVQRYANLAAQNRIQDNYVAIFDKGCATHRRNDVIKDVTRHFKIKPNTFLVREAKWYPIKKLTPGRLYGKGFLILRYPESEHATAFENGIVYDGNQKRSLTSKEFREYNLAARETDSVFFRVCRNY